MSTVKANTLEPASGVTVTITGAALTTPALGTPASGTLTNCTGFPVANLSGYEEGTFTPTMTSTTGTVTVNTGNGRYTKTGNKVSIAIKLDYTTNGSVGTSNITLGALPFTSGSTYYFKGFVVESTWTTSDITDGNLIGNLSSATITWANRSVNQSSRTSAVVWIVADYFAA